jgi:hypothetical protein
VIGGGIDTFCGLNGNGGGELNLGFDEDAALRECHGMSFDDNPPLQLHVEHADFIAGWLFSAGGQQSFLFREL